jgi:hypothetical protein
MVRGRKYISIKNRVLGRGIGILVLSLLAIVFTVLALSQAIAQLGVLRDRRYEALDGLLSATEIVHDAHITLLKAAAGQTEADGLAEALADASSAMDDYAFFIDKYLDLNADLVGKTLGGKTPVDASMLKAFQEERGRFTQASAALLSAIRAATGVCTPHLRRFLRPRFEEAHALLEGIEEGFSALIEDSAAGVSRELWAFMFVVVGLWPSSSRSTRPPSSGSTAAWPGPCAAWPTSWASLPAAAAT